MATYCYPFRNICEQNQTFGLLGRKKLRLDDGALVSALAREYATSRQTILRVRNAVAT